MSSVTKIKEGCYRDSNQIRGWDFEDQNAVLFLTYNNGQMETIRDDGYRFSNLLSRLEDVGTKVGFNNGE